MVATRQSALVRELEHRLDVAGPHDRALEQLMPELRRLLDADRACAFAIRPEGQRRKLDFFYGDGFGEEMRRAFAEFVESAPAGFAAYDPKPDPRQRNVALRSVEVLELNGGKTAHIQRSFFPRFGLDRSDQLRVLVCEGDELLAWVGVFREKRSFTEQEMRLLGKLAAPLQKRLSAEREARAAFSLGADLTAALDVVPAASFVVDSGAAILHANAAGRALLETVAAETRELIAAALSGHEVPAVRLARLTPRSWLAIVSHRHDPAPLVAAARARWSLTPRQSDVLRLVGRGLSNRSVAQQLGCAESTVELHVTALLGKANCESRAELIAKLWSGA